MSGQQRPTTREHRCNEVRGDQGHAGANHSPADVGRKTAAGAAQVKRKSLGQILAEVAELRDRKQAADEIAPQKDLAALFKKYQIGQRQNNQRRHLEDFEQHHAAHAENEQRGKQNAAQQSSHLLPELHLIAHLLHYVVDGFLLYEVSLDLRDQIFARGIVGGQSVELLV